MSSFDDQPTKPVPPVGAPPSGPPPPVPGPPAPPYGAGSRPPASADARGFFGALFDFSFSTFITPMIVKFVYALAMVAIVLVWLILLYGFFSQSIGLGLLWLILGPILMLVYLAFVRMTLEFYLAITRMSEDIHRRLPPL